MTIIAKCILFWALRDTYHILKDEQNHSSRYLDDEDNQYYAEELDGCENNNGSGKTINVRQHCVSINPHRLGNRVG